jgi:hypothetical protein
MWLRLRATCGQLHCWVSCDGVHWARAFEPLPQAAEAWASLGLICQPAEARHAIRLRRLILRESTALNSLAPAELVRRAPLTPPNVSLGEWLMTVQASRPPEADPAVWTRACALRALASGVMPGPASLEVLENLLHDGLKQPAPFEDRIRLIDEALMLAPGFRAGGAGDAVASQADLQAIPIHIVATEDAGQGPEGDAEGAGTKAAVALEDRKAQTQRDKALAEQVGRDAVQQQRARERINANAKELARTDDKADPKVAKSQETQAANDLHDAMNEFADIQRRIGENAQEISKQQDVANPPLLKALQAASKLAKPEDGDAKAENGGNSETAKEPGEQGATAGQAKDGEVGNGLVPSSPERTARMIAGSQAAAKARQAARQRSSPSASSTRGQQPGHRGPGEANTSSMAAQGPPTGSTSGSRGADSTAKASPREEPWMAKLPPEVRKAIGANAQQRPPRGYEELLRRYFQRED